MAKGDLQLVDGGYQLTVSYSRVNSTLANDRLRLGVVGRRLYVERDAAVG
jgi:hypothetical protein